MVKKYITFSHFTLLVALFISAIAAWYSVIGLTAIFAGAVLPIIIMGGILEVAKITTTVWLHRYWNKTGYAIRTYLTIAVIALACLTSMGIFGLLSKAHLEQNVVSGDVVSQISLFDEKIKTQRDNIELARKALTQMDAQVDQRLARGDSESGAERAVQIRRQQGVERTRLQKEIADAQKEIQKLNEQRAPIASQLRKVEAEVGPIKYIAALIYGDNPDITTLERAVRWVIILIVVVFDPLAIVLILAANNSLKWDRESPTEIKEQEQFITKDDNWQERISKVENSTSWPTQWQSDSVTISETQPENTSEESISSTEIKEEIKEEKLETPEESKKVSFGSEFYKDEHITFTPMKWTSSSNVSAENVSNEAEEKTDEKIQNSVKSEIKTENVTTEKILFNPDHEYVHYDGKLTSINALKELRPDLIANENNIKPINFSPDFPKQAVTGEICVRIDVMPHKVYKFNGIRWIMLDKNQNTVYLQNELYVKYLIKKLESGEYDVNELTSYEQDEISRILKNK